MPSKFILLLGFTFSTLLLACKSGSSGQRDEAMEKIAAANGVKEFAKIKTLEFTFNVDRDSNHTERRWKWMPSENRVVFYDTNDSVSFKRMDTSTALLKKLNAQFTNDEYWLIFPLHLEWDKGYTLTDNAMATGSNGKQYRKYTIQYNNKDGFTPGDMYEIFVDENNMLQEWAYHKSGNKESNLVTSWEDYEDFNGLKIAKDHKTADGRFRLYFTSLAVRH